MGLPTPTSTPRIFLPIPGDDETAIEGGMIGIKTADNDGEIWARPVSTVLVPSPAPEQVAKISDVAESESSLQAQIDNRLASLTVDKTLTKTGTATAPIIAQAASVSIVSTDEWSHTDGVLSRTEKHAIGFRKSELLRTYTNPSTVSNRGTFLWGGFLYYSDGPTDVFYKIDSITGDIVQSIIPSASWGYKSVGIWDGLAYTAGDTSMVSVSLDDLSQVEIVNIDTDVGLIQAGLSFQSADLAYGINSSWEFYKFTKTGSGGTTWEATLMSPIGVTQARGVTGDGTHYYVMDANVNYFVRKYLISDDSFVSVSPVLTGTFGIGNFGIYNGSLWAILSQNVIAINPDTLAVQFSETGGTCDAVYSAFNCGKIVGQLNTAPYTIVVYSQPALTLETPPRTIIHDAEFTSTCDDLAGVTHFGDDVMRSVLAKHDHDNKTTLDTITAGMLLSEANATDLTDSGETTLHTHAGIAANLVSINRLNTAVGGISIVSVVAAAPASPTAGDWYLLESGELINYINGAWATYDPYEGAVVRNLDTGRQLKYDGSSWVDALRPTTRTPEFTYHPIPGTVISGLDVLPSDEGNIINIPGPCGLAPHHLFFPSNVTSINNFSCFVSVEPDVTEGCDIGIDSVLEVETDLTANASAWNLPCDTNHLQTTIYRVWVLNGGLSVQSMATALVYE